MNTTKNTNVLFDIGKVIMTPGAVDAFMSTNDYPTLFLVKHITGDWGDVCEEDGATNDAAVKNGERILSSYRLEDGTKMWIITEWDRSVTTFLLPAEY